MKLPQWVEENLPTVLAIIRAYVERRIPTGIMSKEKK